MSKLETDLIHAGEHFNPTRAVVPPIFQTATYYAADSIEQQKLDAGAVKSTYFYHRHGNPTSNQIAELMALLEKTEDALVLATGMAAISTAVLAVVKAGDHVVVQNSHYSAALLFFHEFLPEYGVEVTYVDQTDNQAFVGALRPNTKLVYIETPSNPNLEITDLAFVGSLCRERGIVSIVDNTFCSPINQTPTDFGIDVVVHSATKYLGGHSDLTAGVICGSRQLIARAWKRTLMLGASLSPFDSWLLLRGIKTLKLRVQQINENTLALAQWLERHPKVKQVNYVGLPSHPQHQLAKSQMKGFTGMMTVEIDGANQQEAFANAQRVLARFKIFANAVSLGGVESLVTHPASIWVTSDSVNEKGAIKKGFSLGLLRLSVGIEHIDDLIADFEQALT